MCVCVPLLSVCLSLSLCLSLSRGWHFSMVCECAVSVYFSSSPSSHSLIGKSSSLPGTCFVARGVPMGTGLSCFGV